ncbi:hypothetical protein [Haloplasma contractile]|uniref:DUF304 domain-containing protein n=1 Tax=Haloplasma contractile SSD-17B TaxID=1033810 RepID=U2E8Q6_9MOLU|nr:hypothetical protein [Haloplasma contractile]ERJ11523.1 hypothetical protein HLPCO_002435 [Haloplasma contractile SSD-17B]
MAKKLTTEELDLIYDFIRSDEDVLYKTKPKLIPNIHILITAGMIMLTLIGLIIFKLLTEHEPWFLYSLIALLVVVVVLTILFYYRTVNKLNNLLYVLTNYRMIIFDIFYNDIYHQKKYQMIKTLKVRKHYGNLGNIIFDIELKPQDRIEEIGFKNVEDYKDVFKIIQNQVQIEKIKETKNNQ